MKKVAIVTLTKNPNYGNVLQNIALQKVLKDLGCLPETIINKTGSTLFYERVSIKRFFKWIINHNNARKTELRRKKFIDCCNQYIRYSDICYKREGFSSSIINMYDFFVVGSDQVWNPFFGVATDFEFLTFVPKDKRISYAASFGISDFNKLDSLMYDKMILNLTGFDCISCREENGKKFIEECVGVPCYVHIDPTMLITKEEWRIMENKPDIDISHKYILVYMLGKIDENYQKFIEKMSIEKDAEIINILDIKYMHLGPLEFLWLIDNSMFVFTDSFHATVFSIMFHKEFHIFERIDSYENQNSRFDTLLETLHIPREYVMSTMLDSYRISDWDLIDERIMEEKKRSIEYLKKVVK